MKRLYSILENCSPLLICAKKTPLYAGTVGGAQYSSLEQELYWQFSEHYKVLYPMEYWCSGIVPAVLKDTDLLWEGKIEYTYELIVQNPLFFQKETVVEQKVFWKGKKFLIHPLGQEFRASFSLKRQYKDFSYLSVKTETPFHQGVLLLASFLGSPVLGDHIYGIQTSLFLSALKKKKYKTKTEKDEPPLIQRPAIHLLQVKKEGKLWEAPHPKDFLSVLNNLNKYNTLAEEQFLETWLKNLQS